MASPQIIPPADNAEFRKWLAPRLKPEAALLFDDPMYEPVYEAEPERDPIHLIHEDITLRIEESLNFVSGFRGSGKTTELYRLRHLLQREKHIVIYANALDYLPPAEPLDISDFLIVLAGALSEAIESQLKIDLGTEGYWERFWNFLTRTQVNITELGFQAGTPDKTIGANIKAALREVPSFRKKLREALSGRIGELRADVLSFFDFARTTILSKKKSELSPVFIFDQLEQLRDSLESGGKVSESLTTLLANHRRYLQFPRYHVIYTVPPWVKFVLPGFNGLRMLYNHKLWNNNAKRTPHEKGLDTIRSLVQRRFTPVGLDRFFGPPDKKGNRELVDQLIQASGGHFRDLITLLRETLLRTSTPPTTEKQVAGAINQLRSDYSQIPLDDAQWLHDIGTRRRDPLPDRSPETVQRLTYFLDTHLALILLNGEEWFDLHPIIRDEVREALEREAQMSKKSSTTKKRAAAKKSP